MAKEIDEIKKAAGDYQKWALAARKQYINLRLRQDKEIANLYIRSADRIAKELRQIGTTTISGQIQKKHFKELEKSLRAEAELIQNGLTEAFVDYINSAAKAGVGYTQGVVLNLFDQGGLKTSRIRKLFSRVNKQAVEAIWARTRNGLYLSDRIWEHREKYRSTMRDIIQESVTIGQDAVKTARMLQQYVRFGAMTLARDYPEMMKRMKGRIPGNISYEALRLARTEMTAAFGEGAIAAARVAPSYIGMKWVLSKSHPVVDICDTLSTYDSGLGPGVYPPGNEPPYPAHPNCLCALVPIHEEPEKFVERLKKWRDDPSSDQELEKWYNNIYQEKAAESFPSVPKKTLERAMYDPDYLSQQLNALHGDIVLQDMAEEVGFHKKPTLLSKEEMDAYIQQGNRELFRGIGGRQGEAETYVEQFKTGEYFAGKGVYGNGIYTAYGEEGFEVAKQFAGGVEKNVLRMALKEDAKIISYDALIEMQKSEFTALQEEERALRRKARREADRIYDETEDDDKVEEFLKEAAKEWEEMEKSRQVLADLGRYALYKGYDAIDISSSRFMVVLNRGKVFVQK
jgi:hypothetical protein